MANSATVSPATGTPVFNWCSVPKVSLHEHLDGSLRPQTLIELCEKKGLALPHQEPQAVAAWVLDNANSGSLVRYLEGFSYTVAAMASPEACERIAYEVARDAQAEGCVLAEFRMAPHLFEPHGLSAEAATEAMLAGLKRSGLACGLIVCGMRHQSPQDTLAAARLAVHYQSQGVIAFDLAGAEHGFPPSLHREALDLARKAGLAITCHAGEADSGDRVVEAGRLGARRIGHGVNVVRQAQDGSARWTDEARHMGLHFEVCPRSNVHTGAASSIAEHPITAMLAAGLSVSVSTDNRLMSRTSLCEELADLHEQAGLSLRTLVSLQAEGIRASFLPSSVREQALSQLALWQAQNLLGHTA